MCFLSELLGQLYIGDTQYQKYPCLNQNIVHSKAMTIYMRNVQFVHILCSFTLPIVPSPQFLSVYCMMPFLAVMTEQNHSSNSTDCENIHFSCEMYMYVHFSSSSLSDCGIYPSLLCVCLCVFPLVFFSFSFDKKFYIPRPQQ